MSEIITAVYENGLLRPLNPVSLSEGQTVRLQIVLERERGEPKNEVEEALQKLVDQGKLTISPPDPNILPVSQAEVCEMAKKLGEKPGKPLSEIVIDDRR